MRTILRVLFSLLLCCLTLAAAPAAEETSRPFLITVNTLHEGESRHDQFILPLRATEKYDFTVAYGKKSLRYKGDTNLTLTFPDGPGTYDLAISGTFPAIHCAGYRDAAKIVAVKQWGTIRWKTMASAFAGCANLQVTARDVPDLSAVRDMSRMFWRCFFMIRLNVTDWDVSRVRTLRETFRGCQRMASLTGTETWQTTALTNVDGTFYCCGNLSVINLAGWDMSKVTGLNRTFYGCRSLTRLVGYEHWDLREARNFLYTFRGSNISHLDFSGWKTSERLAVLNDMFSNSTIRRIRGLGSLNVSRLRYARGMFQGTGLLQEEYDRLLVLWDAQAGKAAGRLVFDAGNSLFTPGGEAEKARTSLRAKGWKIADGGPAPIPRRWADTGDQHAHTPLRPGFFMLRSKTLSVGGNPDIVMTPGEDWDRKKQQELLKKDGLWVRGDGLRWLNIKDRVRGQVSSQRDRVVAPDFSTPGPLTLFILWDDSKDDGTVDEPPLVSAPIHVNVLP